MKDVKSCLYLPLNVSKIYVNGVKLSKHLPQNSQLSHCFGLKQHGAYYFILYLSIPVQLKNLKLLWLYILSGTANDPDSLSVFS